jgi:hypothetical protein
MTEKDLQTILDSVDTALKVCADNTGNLSAVEISVKSMLKTVRVRVANELSDANKADQR